MVMLKKEISRTAEEIDGDDVLSVKKELKNMGYYKENEKVGMNKFTDEGLFKGISSFQKDNKLKVDEVIKPGGETEKKINEVRRRHQALDVAVGTVKEGMDEMYGVVKSAVDVHKTNSTIKNLAKKHLKVIHIMIKTPMQSLAVKLLKMVNCQELLLVQQGH